MYCRFCGAENDENTYRCVECDQVIQGGDPPPPQQEHVPSYLAPAILVTIFCCLPFGIVAIVYAAQVSGHVRQGNIEQARKSSQMAKLWSWIGFGAVIIPIIFGILSAIAVPKFAATKERAYVAVMRSDLQNLVLAEEVYFADNITYTSVDQLRNDDLWTPTVRVSVETFDESSQGFSAIATHHEVSQVCGVYVGSVRPPHWSLTEEGVVGCW